MTIKSFKDLHIWQIGIKIAEETYHISKDINYDYSFRDQVRRSAVSISSNIAEGFDRDSRKDFSRFLSIAKASAAELQTQIIIGCKIGYFNEDEISKCEKDIILLMKQIGTLKKYLTRNQ